MDNLTKYLINNAEKLIGSPIRPTEAVLAREDAAVYIWHKMGMSHQLLAEKDEESWKSLSPAAHLYVLNVEELDRVRSYINKFYIELKAAMGSMGTGLWYLVRGDKDSEWWLYCNNESLGSVDIESTEEVEYAADADAALANLVHHLVEDFPKTTELAKCIVLPFGCGSANVWGYIRRVTLLGIEEYKDFVNEVVNPYVSGKKTGKVSPKW